MKEFARSVVESKSFGLFIAATIVINCLLIGVETYFVDVYLHTIQQGILGIFIVEILLRFSARESTATFFRDGWNLFDASLVLISLIPDGIFPHPSVVLSLRILRVFRVLRLLRTSSELKLIVNVLIRSTSALAANAVFFSIFLYLFGIMGVTLFRLPAIDDQTPAETIERLETLHELAPTPSSSPDPYGSLHESMFTLFRITTGDAWTDIRYDLLEARRLELIHTPPLVITSFHILWFSLSAFLLLNLVVGAVVNNYEIIMDEMKKAEQDVTEERL